ncbi:hypothetical protein QE152_g19002 [Popillia japonica]|uniref:Uncharacterized protein n=1 Tax=Popillia japonica TaxID=7064 RepID=A0AAW1L344_POPJA
MGMEAEALAAVRCWYPVSFSYRKRGSLIDPSILEAEALAAVRLGTGCVKRKVPMSSTGTFFPSPLGKEPRKISHQMFSCGPKSTGTFFPSPLGKEPRKISHQMFSCGPKTLAFTPFPIRSPPGAFTYYRRLGDALWDIGNTLRRSGGTFPKHSKRNDKFSHRVPSISTNRRRKEGPQTIPPILKIRRTLIKHYQYFFNRMETQRSPVVEEGHKKLTNPSKKMLALWSRRIGRF